MSGKTYRVPKKVHETARSALSTVGVADLDPEKSVRIAHALTSGMPVGQNVLFAIRDYFFDHVRESMATSDAMLHGGHQGREWANRCIALTVDPSPLTAAAEAVAKDAEFDDLFDMSDEDVDALIEFGNELAKAAGVETKLPKPGDEELALGDPEDLEPESTDPVDELGEHVETALGLATQLDETIEKLASALDEALDEEGERADPEAEAVEMSMVTDALSEVGADAEDLDADFAVMAAEARERVAAAAMARERSKAMARMASVRLTLQAEAPAAAPTEEKAAGPSADAGPKAPGDHHASRQVRDWHGRFAKAGGRVRGKGGNLGYIKSVDDNGQLVITGDDGKEHTVDPKQVEIITKKSPARLPQPMELIEDPKARLDTYLEWAKEQMGTGKAEEKKEPSE